MVAGGDEYWMMSAPPFVSMTVCTRGRMSVVFSKEIVTLFCLAQSFPKASRTSVSAGRKLHSPPSHRTVAPLRTAGALVGSGALVAAAAGAAVGAAAAGAFVGSAGLDAVVGQSQSCHLVHRCGPQ
jgi:hypothetical protein